MMEDVYRGWLSSTSRVGNGGSILIPGIIYRQYA
jgi:hypothetical protein